MPATKECSPVKSAQDLDNLMRYSITLFEQNKKPKAQTTNNGDISNRVMEVVAAMQPTNVSAAAPNYGPAPNPSYLMPYECYGIIGAYLDKRIEAMHDFTDRVPGKHLHTFPSSGNEGLFGFTYLGDVRAWRRDDLIGTKFAKEVDVHESIHTPDEYETRRITEWMMSEERPKYIK